MKGPYGVILREAFKSRMSIRRVRRITKSEEHHNHSPHPKMSDGPSYFLVFYRGSIHNMEFTSAVYRLKTRPYEGLPPLADIKTRILAEDGKGGLDIEITGITPVTRREWNAFLDDEEEKEQEETPSHKAADITPACILM
jgi:hypothetical protein